jgi:hypothetical protein
VTIASLSESSRETARIVKECEEAGNRLVRMLQLLRVLVGMGNAAAESVDV